MHDVLVNRLGGLSLPRKSVVRLTDSPDMTLDVYRGRKTTMQQQQQQFFSLGFKPIQDEADSSVVLAELQVAIFKQCDNQRLSPWGKSFSCSPDPVTDFCLPASLNKICWYIINSGRLPLFQGCYCNLNVFTKDRLKIFFWGLPAVQYCVVSTTLIVVLF